MIFLRSVIFNVLFYLVLVLLCIVALPALLLPRGVMMAIEAAWANTSLFLMRVICNVRIEFRGVENIPTGPLIVASKHQSFWETFALVRFFEHPLFILKRELMMIPVFGWYLKKVGMISVERGGGPRSLIKTMKRAAAEVKLGRQLVIFPEGTARRPALRRTTRPASRRFTPRAACRACRSRLSVPLLSSPLPSPHGPAVLITILRSAGPFCVTTCTGQSHVHDGMICESVNSMALRADSRPSAQEAINQINRWLSAIYKTRPLECASLAGNAQSWHRGCL